MKKISFAKMSGAGNDFVLFDRKFNSSLKLTPGDIRALCARRTGIGADGILIIDEHPDYNFTMEYYNADGSTGSLCGNGARCAIRYAHLMGRDENCNLRFVSNGKEYRGEILDPVKVKFYLAEPEDLDLDLNLKIVGFDVQAAYLNTGSPHVVINIEEVRDNNNSSALFTDLKDFPVYNVGKEIRFHKYFAPGGTNVNFVQREKDRILIRTYERGVEDETLACGTGTTASALICSLKYGYKSPVNLITQGGDELIVAFDRHGDQFRNVSLSGPAEVTFTGEFYSNMYFNNLEK